ncbi:MAG: hypothetical protein ACRD68_13720, partial [Pyrinomonadaceae bacterium]
MALFWRRKKEDRFITLGLNEPAPAAETAQTRNEAKSHLEPPARPAPENVPTTAAAPPVIEPTTTGGAPTPTPVRDTGQAVPPGAGIADVTRAAPPIPQGTEQP